MHCCILATHINDLHTVSSQGWNVRSMNQGKLEVVKEEMTRVNIDILGISELRWTGMDEFNSDVISTTVGKNPIEEME